MQREHKSRMLKTLKSFMQKKQTEGIREKTIKKEQTVLPIIERKTGRLIREEEYGQKAIYFLYHHFIGRVLLKMIFARPYFSFLRGLYYNSFLSKKDIANFRLFCFSFFDNKFHSSSFFKISRSLISSIGTFCSFKNFISCSKFIIIQFLLEKFLESKDLIHQIVA